MYEADVMKPSPGSSPRMRGTLVLNISLFLSTGIIPAYAGNTSFRLAAWTSPRDHPRVCGEHPNRRPIMRRKTGSSPRMRGTLTSGCDVSIRIGIIPAYAGNTSWRCGSRCRAWDHPRVCGEHTMRNFPYLRDEGSSPRMRGTLGLIHGSIGNAGIIPAYAGNTCSIST